MVATVDMIEIAKLLDAKSISAMSAARMWLRRLKRPSRRAMI